MENYEWGGVFIQQYVNTSINGFDYIFFLKQKVNNEYTGWCLKSPVLFKTTNSGANWTQIYSMQSISMCGGSGSFTDFYFTDTANGVALRSGNCMMYTSNGGYNWTFRQEPNISNNSRIGMANSTTGWITKFIDTVLKTNDFFQNFGQQYHPLFTPGEIFVMDTNYAWTGKTGFARTTNGGGNIVSVNIISNEIPKQYYLFQNYPNPFNPITNIKYCIMPNAKGQMSNVKLFLYDVLGKEIITLVNEKQTAGTYEVNWDAEKYPSGIYYYMLITENFTKTKKMVLLK